MERTITHKVATQHQLLKSQLASALRAIEREGNPADLIERLARSLELHLTLEEEHYFPRKRADQPLLGAEIDRLVVEHADLRRHLRESAERLSEGDSRGANAALTQFQTTFDRHERHEHDLLEGSEQT